MKRKWVVNGMGSSSQISSSMLYSTGDSRARSVDSEPSFAQVLYPPESSALLDVLECCHFQNAGQMGVHSWLSQASGRLDREVSQMSDEKVDSSCRMRKATFVSESSGHRQSRIKRRIDVFGFIEAALLLPLFLVMFFRESPTVQVNAGNQ